MNLQYISDSNGNKTGVIIPIEEWEIIRESLEKQDDIPDWHKEVLDERDNENSSLDAKLVLDKIERQL